MLAFHVLTPGLHRVRVMLGWGLTKRLIRRLRVSIRVPEPLVDAIVPHLHQCRGCDALQLDSDDENDPAPANAPADPASGITPPSSDAAAPFRGDANAARPGRLPPMRDGYSAWLKAAKPLWRERRAAVRARRAARGGNGGAGERDDEGPGIAGLGGGMQKQIAAVMHGTWHIVEVRLLSTALYCTMIVASLPVLTQPWASLTVRI
jgi:hypothetical protein